MQSIQSGSPFVQGEHVLTPVPKENWGKQMSEMKQISSTISNISQEQAPSAINSTTVQQLNQQDKASVSVFGAEMKGSFENSLDKVTNSSQGVGDQQSAQMLETALNVPPHQSNQSIDTPQHTEQPKPVSQSATGESATPSTTITKEISSGDHPHLDEATNKAVQSYFNPEQKEVKTADAEKLIENLKKANLIFENGNIDFTALGLDSETILKAGIKGKVFIKDGSFDFKISGKCSAEAQECMKALKDKLEELKKQDGLDVPININPATVGPLSAEDQAALANGGQIQYRSLPNGDVMKLTLDPGSNGDGDGLTIGVYKPGDDPSLKLQSLTKKIPLNVVFEGAELNGKKIGPFLKDWRESKFFENSVIHTEMELLGKEKQTNEDDVGRIQTQNKLWNAVNEYLKASVETSEGHFDINNDVNPSNIQTKEQHVEQNENDVPGKNKTENEVNNDGMLRSDFGELYELPNNKSVNFNSTSISADLEKATIIRENQQGIVGKEENTQQQAQTINSLGTNIAVDINAKASSAQSNKPENIEDLNTGGIKANHSVEIGNATITSENLKSVINIEENTQQQAQTINSLGANAAVDINAKASSATKDFNIDEHFKQLDEEFDKIKNDISKEKYKEFETKYAKYKNAIKAYAKKPNKSKSFTELLNTRLGSIKIKKDEDLLSAAETLAKLMQTVTENLNTIANPEDYKDEKGTIDLKELKDLKDLKEWSVKKLTIGFEIFKEFGKHGITTTNKDAAETVDQLIDFHNENQNYQDYDTLLKAFIEHKKSEAE